jgi:hypothetical protein
MSTRITGDLQSFSLRLKEQREREGATDKQNGKRKRYKTVREAAKDLPPLNASGENPPVPHPPTIADIKAAARQKRELKRMLKRLEELTRDYRTIRIDPAAALFCQHEREQIEKLLGLINPDPDGDR